MGIVSTNERDCRDCYRCVRTCAVKAVQVEGGRARVLDERCVLDGRCIKACPQHAKVVERHLERVQGYVAAGETVVASLAPSFPASFDMPPRALAAALLRLGFAAVEETAVAAHYVAVEHGRQLAKRGGPLITSSCPALINLVGKYYPAALPFVAPVVSPMIAHGRMLRAAHGEQPLRVVFIGPCAAKKGEAQDPTVAGAIDAVLSFAELEEWLVHAGLQQGKAKPPAQPPAAAEEARLFPVEGGLFYAANLPSGLVDRRDLVVSGFDECVDFLKAVPDSLQGYDLVEMMICAGGCLAGPLHLDLMPPALRRRRLLDYAGDLDQALPVANDYSRLRFNLGRRYKVKPVQPPMPSEQEIADLLAKVGKTGPEDELNCGACGYDSCREKAIAVYQGMAELEMCLPYMRRQAESRAARFIHLTPIGIVMVDRNLDIILANPAWCNLIGLEGPMPEGANLNGLVSITPFRRALRLGTTTTEGRLRLADRKRVVDVHVFPLPQEDALVGIFMDVTTEEEQRQELRRVREETLQRTQEVVERQMRTAQEIAGLLGETTADTKVLLAELMELVRQGDDRT